MEHVNDFLTALKYGEEHSTTYTQPVQTAATSKSHARDLITDTSGCQLVMYAVTQH